MSETNVAAAGLSLQAEPLSRFPMHAPNPGRATRGRSAENRPCSAA
jgi:hypothetical protein